MNDDVGVVDDFDPIGIGVDPNKATTMRQQVAMAEAYQSFANAVNSTRKLYRVPIEGVREQVDSIRSRINEPVRTTVQGAAATLQQLRQAVKDQVTNAVQSARQSSVSALSGLSEAVGPIDPIDPGGGSSNSSSSPTIMLPGECVPPAVWNADLHACVEPHTTPTCPVGQHYDAAAQRCVDDPPPPPPPPPTIPVCVQPPALFTGCTLESCISDCESQGGRSSVDPFTGRTVCTYPAGEVVICNAGDNIACFQSPSDCLAFTQAMAGQGWSLVYDDPNNPNSAKAVNVNTGQVILCEGQCNLHFKPGGPCPRPANAPQYSTLIMRSDFKAQWFDEWGNTYGPLCDLSECPLPENDWYNWSATDLWYGPKWLTYSDGKSGWFVGKTVVICDGKIAEDVQPTLDNAAQWIDQQDNPDDWSFDYNSDDGLYYFVNDATGESFPADGQDAAEPPESSFPLEDDDPISSLEIDVPDDLLLFAGRV